MSEQEIKPKKKSLLKRILKWTGISFLVLIIILIAVPVFFKDELKEMVLDEVNKSLNAKVSMGDFDLTFISTFPNMTVELNDTKVEGTGKFKGVELATALGYSSPSKAIRDHVHVERRRQLQNIELSRGPVSFPLSKYKQEATWVTKPGVYQLLMDSQT